MVTFSPPKLLAYYLPQFHRTWQNDKWHGEGFTEWTKVKAAQPLFAAHRQPREPAKEIGYYDLEEPGVLRTQVKLASENGLDGFIFYHYWFGRGEMVLEKPAQDFLADEKIDFDFCFAWCNENWTRRWDGGNNEILLEQKYVLEEYLEFVEYLVPFLKDRRYIQVQGRPVLIVYRPHLIPNISDLVAFLSQAFHDYGLPKPYLVASKTWPGTDFDYSLFDAISEKPLYNFPELSYLPQPEVEIAGSPHAGYIFEYRDVVSHYISNPESSSLPVHTSCSPGWDVTPRHGKSALILVNENPEDFQIWLRNCMERVCMTNPPGERLVFINAWNEWAEGAYLEPDSFHGSAFLHAVAVEKERFTKKFNSENAE